MTIDQMVSQACTLGLPGQITIGLPKGPAGVFTVSNKAFYLEDQKVMHFDQYSGELVKEHTWSDVGILMDFRQFFMRLHEGEYGLANWIILLGTALAFTISTSAGLISYLIRKPIGRWGLPEVPAQFRAGKVLMVMILGMGALFPLFGASLVLIWLWDLAVSKLRPQQTQSA